MIVVDTNVIAYLIIPGDRSEHAVGALRRDAEWLAPVLWRSEFRNVLATYIRSGGLGYEGALHLMEQAESLMRGGEYEVPSPLVLALSRDSGLSAYDCEFVALAAELNLSLVTSDREIVARFPSVAVELEKFAE